MIFHRSLSDSKSPQVSWTLLRILANLNNAIVWSQFILWFSTLLAPFSKPLETIQSLPIGITVTLMFHSFLSSLARPMYSSLFLLFFDLYYYYYYYLLIRVFHISISWWSFTGDWVTASLLKSPGLFSVFWPSSIVLLFGWSPLGCQLPNPPGPW